MFFADLHYIYYFFGKKRKKLTLINIFYDLQQIFLCRDFYVAVNCIYFRSLEELKISIKNAFYIIEKGVTKNGIKKLTSTF